ncbi:PAS domain-containing protein [Pelagibius sp. Alg239-R121]|uniref:PAS domain-containing protein n=1 Tax=Pelagibius sp. Alg239-R121 TaxID=2993448 RepID=UPI0024A65448|nr:PAS domain-containing protein [Pelagibius sp. Alg239-R121]
MQDRSSPDLGSFRRVIAHPALTELYDFWLAHRGEKPAMLRSDLDPMDIPHLLKNLILADVSEGGRAIRYRLVGTEIVTAHGVDYTGKTIEELTSGATLDFTRDLYSMVVGQAIPVFSQGHFRWAGKEHCWTKRLHLPLTRDGKNIDVVLVGQVYETSSAVNREELRPARPEELVADQAACDAVSTSRNSS